MFGFGSRVSLVIIILIVGGSHANDENKVRFIFVRKLRLGCKCFTITYPQMSNVQEQIISVSLAVFGVFVVIIFIFICKCVSIDQKFNPSFFWGSLEYRLETYPLEARIYSGNLFCLN